MIDNGIEIEKGNDPVFENDSMIAVKSNNLKNNTLVGSYVIIPKSEVSSPFELSNKEWEDTKSLLQELKNYIVSLIFVERIMRDMLDFRFVFSINIYSICRTNQTNKITPKT